MSQGFFEKMHGPYSKKENKKKADRNNKNSNENFPSVDREIKDSDELALEEAIKNQVDSLMSIEGDSNKLLPPEARRAKIEQEVRASADFSELGKFISLAFEILKNKGSTYLDKNENEILQQSLDELCRKLENQDLKELTHEKLKMAFAMSTESRKLILKIGIEKFLQEKIDDSLAIFTFLCTVEEEEADYWFRLGLIAKKSNNYELALRALTTTSRLAPDFIGAHLYAAECYIKTGRYGDAKSELKEAKNCENSKDEEWREQILEVERQLLIHKQHQ